MIIGIGSITVDIIAFMDDFPKIGETIKGSKVGLYPGGKTSNALVTAAKLARKNNIAYMIGKWGKDFFSPICKKHFKDMNVDTRYISFASGITNIPLIYVNKNGQNQIVCTPGASDELSKGDIDNASDILKNCQVCVMESGIPFDVSEYASKIIRKNGGITVFDPAPAKNLTPEFLSSFDYILPNETEAEEISGMQITCKNDVKKVARSIHKRGVRNVIITISDKGSLLVNKDREVLVPTYKVKATDPTGAGDAFAGGLVYGLYAQFDIEDCIRLGNVTGALSVTKPGAGSSIPTRDETVNFIKERKISELYKIFNTLI